MLEDGRSKSELLIMLTQSTRVPLWDDGRPDDENLTFRFRGGCTLLIDPESGTLRYAISKSLLSDARKARQARFLREELDRLGSEAIERYRLKPLRKAEGETGESSREKDRPMSVEPFALNHRGSYYGDATDG
jgi:hypothetical protein